jgi:hypothetical protein
MLQPQYSMYLSGKIIVAFLLCLPIIAAFLLARDLRKPRRANRGKVEIDALKSAVSNVRLGSRRWHYLLGALVFAVIAYDTAGAASGIAWLFGIVGFLLFVIGQRSSGDFYGPQREAEAQAAHNRNIAAVAQGHGEREAAKAWRPPVWPPRRPDDWGRELQEAYQVELAEYQRNSARFASLPGGSQLTPPMQPLVPSWEEHHAAEQSRDPLQIRWAQTETGEWVKVVWGNRARPPANAGPLPVYQSVRLQQTGRWIWLRLGENVALDWQRGPQRMVKLQVNGSDGPYTVERPCGSPAHQDAPAGVAPAGEHGASDWQTADAMRKRGNVRRDS